MELVLLVIIIFLILQEKETHELDSVQDLATSTDVSNNIQLTSETSTKVETPPVTIQSKSKSRRSAAFKKYSEQDTESERSKSVVKKLSDKKVEDKKTKVNFGQIQ